MSTLRELQNSFRAMLLTSGEETADLVLPDGMAIVERLDIYRNNVLSSLTKALAATFPAVSRLVDERFFAYAATAFIRNSPPRQACLADYGEAFPAFLESFPPCRDLTYLADVARLEWLMNRALHASDSAPVAPALLGGVAPEDAGRLRLTLHPSVGLLASVFPVDRIWRANRPGGDAAAIDLGDGETMLQIARAGDDVLLRRLDRSDFLFRAAVLAGEPLESAAGRLLVEPVPFDLAAALAGLFQEELVVGVDLVPPLLAMENQPCRSI